MKKMVVFMLLFSLVAFAAGCGSPSSAPAGEEENGADPAATEEMNEEELEKEPTGPVLSSKAQELEQVLMEQLLPLPEFNTGEKIGALIITLANPYWVSMKEGYEKAGEELGIEVTVMAAPTEGDTKSQLETLDAMVARDYAAIVASPIEPFNLVPGVVKANKKGIKIINLGPPISEEALEEAGGYLDGKITVNFEEQGSMAAEYIVEKLGTEGGKVAIIQGIPGAGQSEGRTAGAKKVFEAAENVEIVSIQPGNWDRNTAYNVASNILQAHPDIRAIFCCNDVMALAAADALEAAGKREGVIIFGVDFISEAHEAIKEGRLDGSIAYSMPVYAKAAMILALKIVQGHDVPDEVYSPLLLVSKENVAEFEDWE
ncbi:MAG: substrate-binding domain-containing protein [Firmicutes bacterium]|nr:substrate-binding domain-containing protein [Bacillota bacterium]